MNGKKKKKNSIPSAAAAAPAAAVAAAAAAAGGEKKKAKKTTGKTKRGGKSKNRCNVDIFTEAAMDNAYYVCHNVQDVMKIRGFPWPDAQKKKKKGKKK